MRTRVRRHGAVIVLGVALLALQAAPAWAYIDPGTTQQVWSTLSPFLGVLFACLSVTVFFFRAAIWRFFSLIRKSLATRNRRLVVIGAVLACGIALYAWRMSGRNPAGVGSTAAGRENARAAFKRVIVIGIDGLDPKRVERMMNEGQMPNFSRLAREGTFSTLQTTVPPESPVAWTTAATGVNPGKHGLFDFVGRNPENYLPGQTILKSEAKGPMGLAGSGYVPVTSAKAFWQILSAKGVKTSVIRWPITFPPQKLNGHLLSGLGIPAFSRHCFYTTDPISPDDPEPDRVKPVAWNSKVIETTLSGPNIISFSGQKASTVALRISSTDDAKALQIAVADVQPFTLKIGNWSEWIPVLFPGGLSSKCPAMVRFQLDSIEPLRLYASPVGIDPKDPAEALTWPESFLKDMADDFGRFATDGIPEDYVAARHRRISMQAFLENCDRITGEREKMLDRELKTFDSGLLAFVFDTSDRIQHMFWAADDPTHPMHSVEMEQEFGKVIDDHYRRMDADLAKVMDKADKDTAIFVMSDHGFNSFVRAAHLNRWLIQNGFMHLDGSDDVEGTPLLKNVDWSRTRAYAVGFCSLFLNLKGREGKGCVAPQDASQLKDELVRKLRDWNDPDNGHPVVRNVYRSEEVYKGGYLHDMPDLVIGYHPGYRASWQTGIGRAPTGKTVVENDDLWSGDHLVDFPCVPGTFLSNIRCTGQSPSLVDIAPTVLHALGVAIPDEMDGKPLF